MNGTLFGKRVSEDVIKCGILRWRDCSGLSWWVLISVMSILIRDRQKRRRQTHRTQGNMTMAPSEKWQRDKDKVALRWQWKWWWHPKGAGWSLGGDGNGSKYWWSFARLTLLTCRAAWCLTGHGLAPVHGSGVGDPCHTWCNCPCCLHSGPFQGRAQHFLTTPVSTDSSPFTTSFERLFSSSHLPWSHLHSVLDLPAERGPWPCYTQHSEEPPGMEQLSSAHSSICKWQPLVLSPTICLLCLSVIPQCILFLTETTSWETDTPEALSGTGFIAPSIICHRKIW